MLRVAPVQKKWHREMTTEEKKPQGIEILDVKRSRISAVPLVDYSARVQTITGTQNPRFYQLLRKFDPKYNCPVIINAALNIRGKPIACTLDDACCCFMRTHMDFLAIGNYLLDKTRQKPIEKDSDWLEEFEPDNS